MRSAVYKLGRGTPGSDDSIYGLAAAVWTRDIGKAHRIAPNCAQGRCGSTATNISTPRCLRGYKQSGWAARWATTRWELYTEVKAVTVRI